MHTLADMSEMKEASFPMNAMAARLSFAEKNRDTVKRLQQAYAEGTYQFINNKEKGVAVLSKRFRLKNPKGIEETYQYSPGSFPFPRGYPNPACATPWSCSLNELRERR
jgi:ABC-type nitrate/sulfonate/bicarbonate transport system substrate-binding protein